MAQNPLKNILHQFKHLPPQVGEFLNSFFNEEVSPKFNELFEVKSYGYVLHPGGYFFHTIILKLNMEHKLDNPYEIENELKRLPTELDAGVNLSWYYNMGILHITITG